MHGAARIHDGDDDTGAGGLVPRGGGVDAAIDSVEAPLVALPEKGIVGHELDGLERIGLDRDDVRVDRQFGHVEVGGGAGELLAVVQPDQVPAGCQLALMPSAVPKCLAGAQKIGIDLLASALGSGGLLLARRGIVAVMHDETVEGLADLPCIEKDAIGQLGTAFGRDGFDGLGSEYRSTAQAGKEQGRAEQAADAAGFGSRRDHGDFHKNHRVACWHRKVLQVRPHG